MRRWLPSDSAAFADLNTDPRVMEYFPAKLERTESDALIARIEAHFEQHGYGLWALELRGGRELIGFTGLELVPFHAHFTPAVEIGWRLGQAWWAAGYASEAARAALRFGFQEAGLAQIVSFTAAPNERSRAVMRRIGMSHDPADDFDHPWLDASSRLCRHVLYRLSPDDWNERERRSARDPNDGG